MSEITKMLAALGLLAAGFFGASLFGTQSGPSSGSEWAPQPLEPLEAQRMPVESHTTAPNDRVVAPAGHWPASELTGTAKSDSAVSHLAGRPAWPESNRPTLSARQQPPSIPAISRSGPANGFPPPPPLHQEERIAGLAPPPLLDSNITAVPLQKSTFPSQPPAADLANPGTDFVANSSQDAFVPPPVSSDFNWNAPALQPPANSVAQGEPIWHVVRDGDSLAKLAKRYLGDASRARDIYELNNDVLTNPDLLPIGTELRIPQQVTRPTQFDVYNAEGAAAGSYTPQSRLVPLPQLPSNLRAVPRARLQPPISANLTGAVNGGS